MRRFRRADPRPMARPQSGEGRFDLSPRARLIGGWLAVLVLVLLIAGAVRLFGGNADGSAVLPTPSPSGDAALLPITFGTELGPDRLVVPTSRTDRFTDLDTFAYSVDDAAPADVIFVAVRRTGGGTPELVQAATEGQAIPGAPANIGFRVAAAALIEAFGPGAYEMEIRLAAGGPAIARGTFQLIDTPAPSATTP